MSVIYIVTENSIFIYIRAIFVFIYTCVSSSKSIAPTGTSPKCKSSTITTINTFLLTAFKIWNILTFRPIIIRYFRTWTTTGTTFLSRFCFFPFLKVNFLNQNFLVWSVMHSMDKAYQVCFVLHPKYRNSIHNVCSSFFVFQPYF